MFVLLPIIYDGTELIIKKIVGVYTRNLPREFRKRNSK
jgi:hypothetical protein